MFCVADLDILKEFVFLHVLELYSWQELSE